MSASSDSSSTNPSPLSSIAIKDSDPPRSPKLHGNSKNNNTNLSSPWSQIVHGDYESMNEGPHSSIDHDVKKDLPDALAEISDGKSKKSAWNKPSNGAVEAGPVMGALSWPALADSAKTSSKSSCDPAKTTSNGVSFANQASGMVGSPRKPVMNNSNPNLNRQRSIKRNPGSSNGGNVAADVVQSTIDKPVTHSSNSSPRDNPNKNNHWNEQARNNSFRRGNGGSYPSNFSNRRDMERSNHEWSSPQSFNGRDLHVQLPRAVNRNFPRQPIASPPFINTHPITPLGATMIFPDMVSPIYYVAAPPDSLRGAAPFVAHPVPSSIYFAPPPPDPQLPSLIAKQIEYYFSVDNLCKDTYLRGQMDERGWVPISTIASFNRVKQYTNNISFILDSVRGSNVVEVQGDKIRRRNDWMNWVLFQTNPIQSNAGHNLQTESNSEILANHFESVRLENQSIQYGTSVGAEDYPTKPVHNRSSSGEVLKSKKTFPTAISGEISSPGGLGLSPSARNLDKTD